MLNTYLAQTRDLLYDTDPNNQKFSDSTLTRNINLARKKVALMGQCIRYTPATSAGINSIATLTGGSGYTNGTVAVTISAPDQIPAVQATATAEASGGQIVSVTMTQPGAGYFRPPQVSFASSIVGTTALGSANLGYINQAFSSQEKYFFSAVQLQSGMDGIHAVRSATLIWGQLRYTPLYFSWSRYQSQVRAYVPGIIGPPGAFTQYAQGAAGTLFFYPVPDQPYQMEWDCQITPVDLTTNDTVEAIPDPWRFPVAYFAAFVTLDGVGRYDDAKKMYERFEMFMKQARAESDPGKVSNWYGRSPS